jgi:SAM-dependent methyltransferase
MPTACEPDEGALQPHRAGTLSRLQDSLTGIFKPASSLEALYETLPVGASVLDVGCLGFNPVEITKNLGRPDLRHFGIDYCDRNSGLPAGYVFRRADLNREPIPFDNDSFDLVVASHVLEHVVEPLALLAECVRVSKPMGLLYVATPSERSLFAPGIFFGFEHFASLSFFDDPTHLGHPWTPQSLYRAARYLGCKAEDAGYYVSWVCRLAAPFLLIYARLTRNPLLFQRVWWYAIGWESYAVIRVPGDKCGVHFTYDTPLRWRTGP